MREGRGSQGEKRAKPFKVIAILAYWTLVHFLGARPACSTSFQFWLHSITIFLKKKRQISCAFAVESEFLFARQARNQTFVCLAWAYSAECLADTFALLNKGEAVTQAGLELVAQMLDDDAV
jgi:hypothetical protein